MSVVLDSSEMFCHLMDKVAKIKTPLAYSDLNFLSGTQYGVGFCELSEEKALPIVQEVLEVFEDGVADDSVSLAQLARVERLLEKGAKRRLNTIG